MLTYFIRLIESIAQSVRGNFVLDSTRRKKISIVSGNSSINSKEEIHRVFLISLSQDDRVAIFLPARKVETVVEEKPTSIFANKSQKPAPPQSTSSMSTSRLSEEGADIYKKNPTFAAIIEPIANRFMTVQQLIQVKTPFVVGNRFE